MAFLAVGAAIFGAGTFLAAAVDLGVTLAVSIGLSYAQQAMAGKPQPMATEAAHFSAQGTMQAGGIVPREFPLGQTATGGLLVYHNMWGNGGETPNAYYTRVIRLSDLPGPKLNEIWVNGVKCTLTETQPSAPQSALDLWFEAWSACVAAGLVPMFSEEGRAFTANYIATHLGDGSGAIGGATDLGFPVLEYRKDGKDHLWIKYYDGTQTEADLMLVTKVSSASRPYEATRVGFGVAYIIATSLVEDSLFSGFPEYKSGVSGIPLYDPTKDDTNGGSGPHRYSNPSTWGGDGDDLLAVQAYNVLRGIRYNGQWVYGLQRSVQAHLPTINWNVQIAKCRAPVATLDSQEPAYRGGGMVPVNSKPCDYLTSNMTGCHGKLAEVGGFYKVHLGAPDSPTFSFTDDDIISTVEQVYNPFLTLADSINGIQGSYVEPAQGWAQLPLPPLYRQDYEAIDGNRRLLANPSFELVYSPHQGQRLQSSALEAARRERTHALVLPPRFWIVEPGDVGSWTSKRNGYVNKLFETTAVSDKANLSVGVNLQETDPSDYAFDNDNYVPPTYGPVTGVRPSPQPIIAWFAAPAVIKDSASINRRPAILLSWDGSMPGVSGVRWQVRLKSDQSIVTTGSTDDYTRGSILVTQSLLPNTIYEAQGQYIPSSPRDTLWSDWLTVKTPDVKLSVDEFEDGLKDQVNNQLPGQGRAIDFKLQRIAALLADQDAANALDKVATRVLLREQGVTISETAQIARDVDGKLVGAVFNTIDNNGFVTGTYQYNDGTTAPFTIVATSLFVAAPGVNGGQPVNVFRLDTTSGSTAIYFDGDYNSPGSIKAFHLEVAELSAITSNLGTIRTGLILSEDELVEWQLNNGGALICYQNV